MSKFSITCTKENLLLGLAQVVPVAGRNTQLPILRHILLQNKNNVIHLTSTDLEIGIHTIIGGKTNGSGAVTIPARSLFAYIQQLPAENPLTLQVQDNTAHLTTVGFAAQFPVGNPDDFPLLPKGKKEGAIEIAGDVFCRALGQVLFAAARDETRPEIRGVYVKIEDGVVRLAATDSFRLAEEIVVYSGTAAASFILPLPSAQEVMRLFSQQETMFIAPQDNYILLFSDEIEVSSRLIDGAYPDYQQIIPKSSKTTLKISRDEFLRALKTLSVFLTKDSRRVELDVQPNKGVLVARVAGGGTGEGVVEIPIEGGTSPFKVLVNIQYILEGLSHITSPMCALGLSGETSPIVIRPDTKAKEYVYVVMPIRS